MPAQSCTVLSANSPQMLEEMQQIPQPSSE